MSDNKTPPGVADQERYARSRAIMAGSIDIKRLSTQLSIAITGGVYSDIADAANALGEAAQRQSDRADAVYYEADRQRQKHPPYSDEPEYPSAAEMVANGVRRRHD